MDTFRFLVLCLWILRVRSVTIRTPQGLVDGRMETVDGMQITKFLGIPYAQAPIDALRFKLPRPPANFTGTYDAKYGRALCPQPRGYLGLLNLTQDRDVVWHTSEDCLFLNVYIPGTVRPGHTWPVMLWIHGGSCLWGSGTHYDGRRFAAHGGVILVTINYRLGLLGFFPNGKEESNLGLADQIEALRWVKKHIWSYGGDPSKVTIFGESAGGSSVSLLSTSPPARGLFSRAISQSGLANSAWAMFPAMRLKKLETIAMKVDVRPECALDLLPCLKMKSADELVALSQFVINSLALSALTPEIDNHFVLEQYNNASLVHPDLEFIIGFNTDEGGTMMEHVCYMTTGEACEVEMGIKFQSVRKWVAPIIELPLFERLASEYEAWYPGARNYGRMSLRAASRFTTDWFERFPANQTATKLRDAGFKVYAYEFNAPPRDKFPLLMPVPWSEGALHCDELPFVFGLTRDKGDRLLALKMIHMWTSFAKG